MTDKELNRLEAMAAAATPGPWRLPGGKSYVMPSHGEPYKVAQLGGTRDSPGLIAREDDRLHHDAELIAAARGAVPALCAEVRRQRAAVAKFLAAAGNDLCHENRRELAHVFGIELPSGGRPGQPPEGEFRRRCDVYRQELYGPDLRPADEPKGEG